MQTSTESSSTGTSKSFSYTDLTNPDEPDGPFTLVSRKKKKIRNTWTKKITPGEKLERTLAELRSDSNWLELCIRIIRDAVASLPSRELQLVLCLGLGSPTESAQARFQLCFLLELRNTILPRQARIEAFDPVFSPEDKELLTSLGIQIIQDDKATPVLSEYWLTNSGFNFFFPRIDELILILFSSPSVGSLSSRPSRSFDLTFSFRSLGIRMSQQGKHALEGTTTLAYMPHCDRELYENFLQTNWRPQSLSNLLLIGNDLRGYIESIPSQKLGKESPCIARLGPLLTSTPIPQHSVFPNAFSITAVQHINPESLVSFSPGVS